MQRMPVDEDTSPPEDPTIADLTARIEEMTPEDRRTLNDSIASIVSGLDMLAQEQVQKKYPIEQRWLEDLRQYNGRYTPATEKKLTDGKQSKVFANLTRPKTHGWAARVGDILFPTDDKNWQIGPTPVPDLLSRLQSSRFEAIKLTKRANLYAALGKKASDTLYADQMKTEAAAAAKQAEPLAQRAMLDQAAIDEAKSKSDAMEAEIEDQLIEAQFGIKARTGIRDMCKLGTAIMKGPLSKTRVRGSWSGGPGAWELNMVTDPRPEWQRVDPWNWFPDMNARTVDEAEFFFERHLYTKREMRRLAKRPDFDTDAIRELLKTSPRDTVPTYLTQMREITGNLNVSLESRYVVWEYHGALEGHQIDMIARRMLPPKQAAEMIYELDPEDPLREYPVVLWFCNGRPIKIGPHPLDSGEPIYSAAAFVEDDTSIFGLGVPYLARNAQAIINGAWRMMMDNADISVGPQVVINRNVLEPADGDWDLRGFKEWLWQQGKTLPAGSAEPFQVFQTNSNLQYLLEVVKLGMLFLDEEVSLPLIAQGEQGAHVTDTAEGMGMLMNAANVIFRDVVRAWDDRITVPCLTRAYDWNMQHNPKEHIKGDMDVEARGSSVLLVREMQSRNLTAFLEKFGGSPIYGKYVKHAEGLRELSKTLMLDSKKIVKTDEESAQEEQEAMQNPPPPNADQIKLQIAEMEDGTKRAIAMSQREVAMIGYASKSNQSLEKINADLTKFREQVVHEERMGAVDVALTQRQMVVKAAAPHPDIATTGTVQ